MKRLILMTAATFLALSSLRAQNADGEVPSADMDSGSDTSALPPVPATSDIAAPTTPQEASALEESLYGAEEEQNEAPASPEAQSRPWKLNYHAGVETRYDSNIFITSANRQHDVLTDIIAGAGVTLGDYTAQQGNFLITDYTGVGEFFGTHSSQDAYNQKGSANTQIVLGHLTLKASFSLEDAKEENIDIGARARSEFYIGNFSGRYDISDKDYLEATGQFTVANYQGYLDSDDELGGLSFDYLPDPSITVGLGATAGVLHVQDAPSQTYQQLLASLKVDVTDKFTMTASAGGEHRAASVNGDIYTPVFDLAGDYKPSEELDISLLAYRKLEGSASYVGSDFISTGVSASVRYDLSARFSLMLQGGYENDDYRAVSTGAGVTRNDNYLFVRPAFRYIASRNCSFDLYYFYRNNDSTLATSAFTDHQLGGDVNFSF